MNLAITAICLAASVGKTTSLEQPSPVDAVRLEQHPGAQVPLDVTFRDESGATVQLGDYVKGRPVLLVPAYYRCPMLCTLVISGIVNAIVDVGLEPGRDFQVVVFSIDPREQPTLAAEKKLNYLRRFGRNDTQDGWHFLTGEQAAIERVTRALGYGYVYDPATKQYAHPAAIAALTPDGRIARYLLGVKYDSRDVRLALVEASQGTVGNVVDQVLLRCFAYDPVNGRYGFAVMTALRIGGVVTILGTIGVVGLLQRRRRRQQHAPEPANDPA